MSESSGVLSMPADLVDTPPPDSATVSFTDYVRALEPGGKAPEPEAFDQLLQRLRGVLVLELKRRSLWYMQPRCLGIFGPATWQEPGAIDELVADCYRFVFLSRIGSLRAHLGVKANVDGLVFRSIHNYLYDQQKKYDPLGFRVFTILQLAIRHSCENGLLYVLAGDIRVRNDTVLSFNAEADPDASPPRELGKKVASWNDDLLPALVTARGKKLNLLVERLAESVEKLRETGLEVFAFTRLLEPLKEDARQRWNAIWAHSEGHLANDSAPGLLGLTRPMLPDTDFEQHQTFEWLILCVSLRLERLTETPRTHDHLRRLWTFLRHQVTESSDTEQVSRRRISSLLGIPRDRLPRLYATLGRLIRGCQEGEPSDPSTFREEGV